MAALLSSFVLRFTTVGLAGAALLLGTAVATATMLQVRPLGVVLDAGNPAGRLTVVNPGSRPVLIQVDGYDWTQDANGDRLTPSGELLVNPAIFRIRPDGRQTVRVGLRHSTVAPIQRNFRMVLRELPTAAPVAGRLRFNLEISIPVFVNASTPGTPRFEWTLEDAPDDNGQMLTVHNTGSAHGVISALRVRGPLGEWRTATRTHSGLYLLPGTVRRWHLDGPVWPSGTVLVIEADSPRGQVRDTLLVP